MKMARFPGKSGTVNSTVHVQLCNRQRPMHGGFDSCYSSVLVLHGEDEEYNVNTTSRPPPLSTCSLLEPVGALMLAVHADGTKR